MKRLIASAMILCFAAAGGCGRESHHPAHGGAEKAAPEPAPPTPDTTPIEALRTPAGLVLKIDGAQTPAPSLTPTPAP